MRIIEIADKWDDAVHYRVVLDDPVEIARLVEAIKGRGLKANVKSVQTLEAAYRFFDHFDS